MQKGLRILEIQDILVKTPIFSKFRSTTEVLWVGKKAWVE